MYKCIENINKMKQGKLYQIYQQIQECQSKKPNLYWLTQERCPKSVKPVKYNTASNLELVLEKPRCHTFFGL